MLNLHSVDAVEEWLSSNLCIDDWRVCVCSFVCLHCNESLFFLQQKTKVMYIHSY